MEKKSFIKKIIDGFKNIISTFKSDDEVVGVSSEDRIAALSKSTGSSENEIAEIEAAFNAAEANLSSRIFDKRSEGSTLADYVVDDFDDAQIAKEYQQHSSGKSAQIGKNADSQLFKE